MPGDVTAEIVEELRTERTRRWRVTGPRGLTVEQVRRLLAIPAADPGFHRVHDKASVSDEGGRTVVTVFVVDRPTNALTVAVRRARFDLPAVPAAA